LADLLSGRFVDLRCERAVPAWTGLIRERIDAAPWHDDPSARAASAGTENPASTRLDLGP
jgi:hypothetical protein